MNNPKLTNALLIALLVINSIFFLGMIFHSGHHHHRRHHHHHCGMSFNEGRWHGRSFGDERFIDEHRNFGGFNNGMDGMHHSHHHSFNR